MIPGLHSIWPELFPSYIASAETNFQEWKQRYIGQQYMFSVIRHKAFKGQENMRVEQFAPINIRSTLYKALNM